MCTTAAKASCGPTTISSSSRSTSPTSARSARTSRSTRKTPAGLESDRQGGHPQHHRADQLQDEPPELTSRTLGRRGATELDAVRFRMTALLLRRPPPRGVRYRTKRAAHG